MTLCTWFAHLLILACLLACIFFLLANLFFARLPDCGDGWWWRRGGDKVCEMWWTQERSGGEHLVAQLLPLMLVRSLDVDAKEADVKRMYG